MADKSVAELCVAHVNVAKGYRGGERQTELLMCGLEARGVRQVLVARRGGELARRARGRGCGFEVRPVSGNPLSVAVATGGVDLVHVHEGRSVYGAWLRCRATHTPYVVTRRVDNPIRDHWLAHQAYRRAARVAALTPQVEAIAQEFDARIRTSVIHSSSSGLVSDPAKVEAILQRFSGKFLVGHVGALDPQKGQEYIIGAARMLQDSHPNLHFLLVGSGRDEVMLREAASDLRNLTFIGFVDNVGDYLEAFDLFVFPSRWEGLGSILLDAMERGLPIIASRVGGIPEVIHDGENGLLVEPGQHEPLYQAILKLRADPDYCKRLAAHGQNDAQRFTADVMSDKYLALYRELLGA